MEIFKIKEFTITRKTIFSDYVITDKNGEWVNSYRDLMDVQTFCNEPVSHFLRLHNNNNPTQEALKMNDFNFDIDLDLFGGSDVISRYTRSQAIEDGVLIDLSTAYPRECRTYKYPVACTSTVWAMVEAAVNDRDGDHAGLVWDLCWMSHKSVTRRIDPTTVIFCVIIGPQTRTLKAVCGPGDQGEPVITIMGEYED